MGYPPYHSGVNPSLGFSPYLESQAKEKIIQSINQLLAQVDDEENFQKNTHVQNVAPLYR